MAYRAAIIGLGFIGGADQVSGDALGQEVADLDGTHLAALAGHTGIELVAGSSRDEGRRERFHDRTGATTYDNWQTMLAEESLDIVSVATYAPQHAEMTLACLEHGVRVVYCEKPIATNLRDAEAMVKRAEDAGALLVLNHNRRFNPAFRKLRDCIHAGQLGNLQSGEVAWGSGRLGNVGTHMFNAVQMLTGRRIEAVQAKLDLAGRPDCRGPEFQDPGGWGQLRLEEDLLVEFKAGDYESAPGILRLVGSRGSGVVQDGTVRICRDNQPDESIPVRDGPTSSMDVAVTEIVDWLDGKAPFPDSAEESMHTLEAIVACHASHRAGETWKSIPLVGSDRDIIVASG